MAQPIYLGRKELHRAFAETAWAGEDISEWAWKTVDEIFDLLCWFREGLSDAARGLAKGVE